MGQRIDGLVELVKANWPWRETDADQIAKLLEQKESLKQRREQLDDDIIKLEKVEGSLLTQGKQETSKIVKKRLAREIAELRRDLGRQNAIAGMYGGQIKVIGTNIHNMVLLQEGRAIGVLPDVESLTINAVRAEEFLETVQAAAETATGLDAGMNFDMAQDEAEILAEFDAPEIVEELAETVPPIEQESFEDWPVQPVAEVVAEKKRVTEKATS